METEFDFMADNELLSYIEENDKSLNDDMFYRTQHELDEQRYESMIAEFEHEEMLANIGEAEYWNLKTNGLWYLIH